MTRTRESNLSWLVLGPALTIPFLGALLYFVVLPGGPVGQIAYGLTKVFALVFPLLFLRRIGTGGLLRRRDPDKDARGAWPSWRAVTLTGALSGTAIAALGIVLMLTPFGAIVRENAGAVTAKVEDLGFKENFVFFALFVSVMNSAMEEYYWRWFVYGQLRGKVRRWAAHGIAAVAFGGHHLVITMQFFPTPFAVFLTACVVVGGLIWSLLYERQGTVVGCWLSHFCVDVFIMVIGYQLIMAAG